MAGGGGGGGGGRGGGVSFFQQYRDCTCSSSRCTNNWPNYPGNLLISDERKRNSRNSLQIYVISSMFDLHHRLLRININCIVFQHTSISTFYRAMPSLISECGIQFVKANIVNICNLIHCQ